mmetsp:Transcript_20795/g.30813  ORF Transcript_20795/g.30813 Transcript_20795/m.30813 type:complete len:613 (+) Transcript_20795:60-1898(+)
MAEEPPSSSKWPDAAPPEGQQTILTISCGNSHIHWATHDISSSPNNNANNANEFAPSLFWRTPHINDDDMKDGTSPAMILSRMLPESIHDYIFGAAADASNTVTEEMAQDQSQKRAVEKLSVYVVYTNADQLTKLEKLCAAIPSNFVVLDGDDFFNEEQGRYNGMGVDRLATLTGAVYFYGHPALVFDGGTATTYSATNCEGKVLGGGIGPGIQSKLQSMSKDTDALPNISALEVKERVKETEHSGKPLPTFARSTKEAMMVDVFQEFAGKGKNVIERWIEHAYSNDDKKQPPMGTKYNEDRIVTCTGGDGDIFCELLQPCHGGVIEAQPAGNNLNYQVRPNKHLIHYGISAILNMQVLARRNKAKFDKAGESHVGKRVAKVFDVESDDGDNIFRGSVTEEIVVEEKTLYRITYDDGDDEDVTAESLFDMLELYKQHGEKKKAPEAKPKNGKKKVGRPKKNADSKPKEKAEGKPKVNADSKPKENADSKPTEPKSKANIEAPKFPIKPASKKHANAAGENDKLPTAKKPKTKDDIKDMVQSDPNSFVNKRVAKDFDGECFFGKITKYDDTEPPPFWHVVYDDGDEEDFSSRDLIKSLKHYKKHGKDDKNASD